MSDDTGFKFEFNQVRFYPKNFLRQKNLGNIFLQLDTTADARDW
jgi:hypothetical protein